MSISGRHRISCPSYIKEARFAGRICAAGFTAAEKLRNAVILSEAKNLSLFFLLYLNRGEILRFAQNDRTSHFFRSLFSLHGFVLAGVEIQV
jgi:hypothetical protein